MVMSSGKEANPILEVTADAIPKRSDEGKIVPPLIGSLEDGHGNPPTPDPSGDRGSPDDNLPQTGSDSLQSMESSKLQTESTSLRSAEHSKLQTDSDSLQSTDSSKFKMDVHSRVYVPEALKSINRLPSVPVLSQPLPVQQARVYIATFAGNAFLDSHPHVNLDHHSIPRHVAPLGQLHPLTYRGHFQACLLEEHAAQVTAMCSYDLFSVPMEPFDPSNMVFSLMVPGLRDGVPEVGLGDIVLLRQLILNPHTSLPIRVDTHPPNSDESLRHGFTGLQHVAVIYGISKAEERLLLRVEGLRTQMLNFNVSFQYPERFSNAPQRALSYLSSILEAAYDFSQSHRSTAQPPSTSNNQNPSISVPEVAHSSSQSQLSNAQPTSTSNNRDQTFPVPEVADSSSQSQRSTTQPT